MTDLDEALNKRMGRKKMRLKELLAEEAAPEVTQKVTPEPITVIVKEPELPAPPKLSARTLAEMEAGRKALEKYKK
jgi:hypothetical protein